MDQILVKARSGAEQDVKGFERRCVYCLSLVCLCLSCFSIAVSIQSFLSFNLLLFSLSPSRSPSPSLFPSLSLPSPSLSPSLVAGRRPHRDSTWCSKQSTWRRSAPSCSSASGASSSRPWSSAPRPSRPSYRSQWPSRPRCT